VREVGRPYVRCKERVVKEELCKGGFLVSRWPERALEVKELAMNLKALDAA